LGAQRTARQDQQRRLAGTIARRRQLDSVIDAATVSYDVGKRFTPPRSLPSLWLALFIFPRAAAIIFYRTREGKSLLSSQGYDPLRQEIALYQGTEAILDRLTYQLSVGDSVERGGGVKLASAIPGLSELSLTGKRTRSMSRERRPFTALSVVGEYRAYVAEVLFRLGEAISSDREARATVRIVVAIDELDKMLDEEQLHNFLKSIKAVFDIPGVYYLISISEDAIGTYRLRHVETKNEIDSAFSHMFVVPPMNARSAYDLLASIDTSAHGPRLRELFPAIIVNGAGVPRDIKRLLQLAIVREDWRDLSMCVEALLLEEQEALIQLVEQHPAFSAALKYSWISGLRAWHLDAQNGLGSRISSLGKLDVLEFVKLSPATESDARKAFYRIQTMMLADALKGCASRMVLACPTPDVVTSTTVNVTEWLDGLDTLSSYLYQLSSDPLSVWEQMAKGREMRLD
jgi:hypothetical protein